MAVIHGCLNDLAMTLDYPEKRSRVQISRAASTNSKTRIDTFLEFLFPA